MEVNRHNLLMKDSMTPTYMRDWFSPLLASLSPRFHQEYIGYDRHSSMVCRFFFWLFQVLDIGCKANSSKSKPQKDFVFEPIWK